jgi:hypothetical protein
MSSLGGRAAAVRPNSGQPPVGAGRARAGEGPGGLEAGLGRRLGWGSQGRLGRRRGGRRLPLRPSLRRGRRSCWAVRGSETAVEGCGGECMPEWRSGGLEGEVHRGRP